MELGLLHGKLIAVSLAVCRRLLVSPKGVTQVITQIAEINTQTAGEV